MAANGSSIRDNFPPAGSARAAAHALACVMGAFLAVAAQAADDAGIESLAVKPASYPAAVLMPNAQPPAAPPATPANVVEAWWSARQAAGEAAADVAPVTLRLGPATPAVDGRAYLVLTKPAAVHPEATVEFAADSGGIAAVKLQVAAGQPYLLDFAVSGTGPGTYELAADGARRTFEDPHGDRRHLLLELDAGGSGWTTVRLKRQGGGFHLHGVEITGAPSP